MNGAATDAVVTAIIGSVIYGCVVWWALRRARRTYSRAIVRQLKRTGHQVEIKVSDRRGTWNPAMKGVAGRLFANGRAVYSLDASGVVHLEFHPVAGGQQHYEDQSPHGMTPRTVVVGSGLYDGYGWATQRGFLSGW